MKHFLEFSLRVKLMFLKYNIIIVLVHNISSRFNYDLCLCANKFVVSVVIIYFFVQKISRYCQFKREGWSLLLSSEESLIFIGGGQNVCYRLIESLWNSINRMITLTGGGGVQYRYNVTRQYLITLHGWLFYPWSN